MALIKCEECGKEISDKADKCPNCGAPNVIKKAEQEKEKLQKEKDIEQKKKEDEKNGLRIAIGMIILFIILGIVIGITTDENSNTQGITITNSKSNQTTSKQDEKEFKASCNVYTYEQLARNPEKIKGKNVKLTGQVIQVVENLNSTTIMMNITKEYDVYYSGTIYIVYHPQKNENKILEDDIITIYGTSQGDTTYITVLGASTTVPKVEAKYIELLEK